MFRAARLSNGRQIASASLMPQSPSDYTASVVSSRQTSMKARVAGSSIRILVTETALARPTRHFSQSLPLAVPLARRRSKWHAADLCMVLYSSPTAQIRWKPRTRKHHPRCSRTSLCFCVACWLCPSPSIMPPASPSQQDLAQLQWRQYQCHVYGVQFFRPSPLPRKRGTARLTYETEDFSSAISANA